MDPETQGQLLQEIRADVKSLGTGQAVLASRVDSMERRLGGVEGKVDGLAALLVRFDAAERRLSSIEPRLDLLDRWQARVLGGAAAIAALAGGLTGVIARALGG